MFPSYNTVAVVGSRYFSNKKYMYEKLNELVLEGVINGNTIIISGGAKGADTLAQEWANEMDKPFILFPAEWEKYGKRAGPIRNSQIVDQSNTVIAFPSKTSIGTWDTINKARKKNKHVRIYDDW